MIKLAQDCLIIRNASGEGLPCVAGSVITVELSAETASLFDAEFIKHAANAVLHYFREEVNRQTVTMAEFTLALEKVLRGFQVAAAAKSATGEPGPRVLQSDLVRLLAETRSGGELVFFPRLREELRTLLSQSPQMLCFQGIRLCVKQMTGARRWCGRCQALHDQIVEYLRGCIAREDSAACALVVR